jgi:hypothetical protein
MHPCGGCARIRRGHLAAMRSLLTFFLSLLLLCAARPAAAHSVFENKLWLEYSETQIDVRVHVSAREICTVAGIPVDNDGRVETALVEDAAPKHDEYFFSHFTLKADGMPLAGTIREIRPPVAWEGGWDGVDRSHFTFFITYSCATPPRRIALEQQMMKEFSYSAGTPFNFSYIVDFSPKGQPARDFGPLPLGGVLDFATGFGSADAPPEAPRTAWDRFVDFLKNGITHVLHGYDHLLFAAALVLALRSFWDVFKIVGLFTLAHSLTVTLSAYRLLVLPKWVPIEPLISASIIVVALENILFPRSTLSWRRMTVVFIFGLVHGMGLAGAFVAHLEGFPSGMIAWAVIAFCLGVEIGHLAIVAPLSGIMFTGRRIASDSFHRPVMRWGSVLVALGGAYFLANSLGWLPAWMRPDRVFGSH